MYAPVDRLPDHQQAASEEAGSSTTALANYQGEIAEPTEATTGSRSRKTRKLKKKPEIYEFKNYQCRSSMTMMQATDDPLRDQGSVCPVPRLLVIHTGQALQTPVREQRRPTMLIPSQAQLPSAIRPFSWPN